MSWQTGYSTGLGPFGIGAGSYTVDLSGDKFQRGILGEHPTIGEAKTLTDFSRAVLDGLNKGGMLAIPGLQPGLISAPVNMLLEAFGQERAATRGTNLGKTGFVLDQLSPHIMNPVGSVPQGATPGFNPRTGMALAAGRNAPIEVRALLDAFSGGGASGLGGGLDRAFSGQGAYGIDRGPLG